ncbi:MAG TPA: DNA integrity scanning diadenylate cyclase DisA, partial [Acidimicrobiales bacterium]|nr:DNA integrity scanning diadenylate cyclase DisA [Acidimicrobiales bacterium]
DADVESRPSAAMADALALVAPGRPLRLGLERVLLAKRGALIAIGDDPTVLSICTGGFLIDGEFSPQRLTELAKMDGAIILSADASRIARANVHLMPNPSVPTSETGTRHRTAERMARSVDVPVVSVSAAMGVITVYRHDQRHVLQPAGRLHDTVSQALQTLQRFRQRFDLAVTGLSALELEDTVTLRDVAAVLQPADILLRVARDLEPTFVELGDEGQLLRLQLDELLDGVEPVRALVVRDYLHGEPSPGDASQSKVVAALARLSIEEVLDAHRVGVALGLSPAHAELDASLEPRGYRLLYRLPRFPDTLVDRIVAHFGGLQKIMRASVGDLEEVEGVGEARARSVKDGLARLAEATILDRYN